MKNCVLRFTILFLVSGFSFRAQVNFQKTFGKVSADWSTSIQQTYDGGYIIGGLIGDSAMYSASLVKADANGDILWSKVYMLQNKSSNCLSVIQTKDSGYAMVGFAYDLVLNSVEACFIRTDADGDTLWTKTFRGWGFTEARSVWQTTDDGFIIAGYTNNNGPDLLLIKTNNMGDTIWTKTYGGVNNDFGNSVMQTLDGGYIVAGNVQSFAVNGGQDIYLIKTDAAGNTQWAEAIGNNHYDEGYCVKQTSDSGFVISGYTVNGSGNSDVYLVKTNSAGNVQWSKSFGETADNDDGKSVVQTFDGGYILTGGTAPLGTSSTNLCLIRTDNNGDTVWTKALGGSEFDAGYSVIQSDDSCYVIAGSSESFGSSNHESYFIKTDLDGNTGCNMMPASFLVTTVSTLVTNLPAAETAHIITTGSNSYNVLSGVYSATQCYSISVGEVLPEDFFSVFPNPVSTTAIIKSSEYLNDASLIIYTMHGLVAKEFKNINGNEFMFDRSNLPSGVYLVRLYSREKFIWGGKLIILDYDSQN